MKEYILTSEFRVFYFYLLFFNLFIFHAFRVLVFRRSGIPAFPILVQAFQYRHLAQTKNLTASRNS